MATIEQQIKNIDTAGSRASGIGLVLGIGAGLLFEQSVKPGGGPGLYLGVAVWYATFSIGKNLAGRERGRLRAAIGVLIGLAVFSVTLVFTNDLVALLAPPALAYLATEVLFNNAVYAIRPVERFEDQIVHLLSSTEAPKQPAKVRQKVEALQLKRLQFLKRQFEQQLAQAERAPATEAAGRAFNHLVQTLTAISNLPADLKPLLGRAYLGLARHQAAAGGDAARRHRQVSETIKRAQAYPLPPDSIQFIARHYAAANDHSPDAVKAYTAYLRARAGQPFDPQDPVTLAAQAACAIGRSASASWLKEVETRARAFFDADNRLGWAALRLGQSLLWQGNSRQALEPLNKAVELLPDNVEAIFAVGQAHWALNHSNLALDAFRRASTLDPRNVEIMFWLGYALVADGRAERLPAGRRKNTAAEARRHLEAVVSEQPERGEAYYALALAHMAGDDHAGARSQFESALSLDSTQADWHYHYARALVALADYPAAVDAARKAIGCESKHRPALLLLGNELFRVRQWAEAESSYRTLLGLDATDTEAHIGLGRALFEQGHYAEAVEHLQAPAAPTHDSLYALGRAYAMLDDFQQAQAAYQQALAKFGPDADLCYALGCAHARLGQFDAALTAFDQSLAQQQSGRAHVQRGHVYLSLGDRGAAQAEYQAALHVAPRLPDAHYALGLYHYRSGDLDSARAAFANALRCDPNHAPAYFGLGTILEARAEYAPACDEYQKASAAGGPVHQLKLRLGVVAVKQERFEEAIPLLAGAWQAGIQTDELMYNLGLAHAKQSHWAEALEAWLPLAQRAPDDERLCINIARCRYQLGHQHFAAGDYAAATQAWQACMDVYGGDATLKRALAEAYLRWGIALLKPVVNGEPIRAEARAAFQQAREFADDDDRRIQFFEALAALAEGDHPASIHILRQLHERDGGDGHVAYHLAFALQQAGQLEFAAPLLGEAVRAPLPPHLQLGANLMLAEAHAAAGRWIEAAGVYRAALEAQARLEPQWFSAATSAPVDARPQARDAEHRDADALDAQRRAEALPDKSIIVNLIDQRVQQLRRRREELIRTAKAALLAGKQLPEAGRFSLLIHEIEARDQDITAADLDRFEKEMEVFRALRRGRSG